MKVTMITHDRKIDRRIIQQAETLRAHDFDISIVAMPSEHQEDTNIPIIKNAQMQLKDQSYNRLYGIYKKLKRILHKNTKVFAVIRSIFIGKFIFARFLPINFRYMKHHLTPTIFFNYSLVKNCKF